MNRNRSRTLFRKSAVALAALLAAALQAVALTPGEWRHTQALEVDAAGLARMELPPETLDAARPSLEDLRLLDGAGNEVPYLIQQSAPVPGSEPRPAEFHATLENQATVIIIRTGVTAPNLTAITLETPAQEFIKALRVEGSHDGKDWQQLVEGEPIFRQRNGAEKLTVALPNLPSGEVVWEFLRLTIDDSRSQPVPFTGARLHMAGATAPTSEIPVTIKSRDESPGVTRVALDLGAANLLVSSLHIETPGPLFTRTVTVAVQEVADDGVREQPLAQAVIYRINIEGKNESALDIPLERTIHSRELLLLIRNQDSPPLAIDAVRATRRPSYLVFYAKGPGHYTLLTGNSQCPAPRYDLPALGADLDTAAAAKPVPGPLTDNPDYKSPEALASLTLEGVNIDLSGWKFRKAIQLSHPGPQELELDLDVLSHASPYQRDLRVVRDGKQLPFLLDHPSISRSIAPVVTAVAPDPKTPSLSRWSLKLPQAALPVTRLTCASQSPLFMRNMRVWEEVTDDMGNKNPREIGHAIWQQTPDHPADGFAVVLDEPPLGDTLFLETDNGDNPAIELHDFRFYYPVTRVLFKAVADPTKPVSLYYGNPETPAPSYDLSLVGGELLRAEKSSATTGAEEALKPEAHAPGQSNDRGTVLFWIVLAGVVIGLLALIARLLPKAAETKP